VGGPGPAAMINHLMEPVGGRCIRRSPGVGDDQTENPHGKDPDFPAIRRARPWWKIKVLDYKARHTPSMPSRPLTRKVGWHRRIIGAVLSYIEPRTRATRQHRGQPRPPFRAAAQIDKQARRLSGWWVGGGYSLMCGESVQ